MLGSRKRRQCIREDGTALKATVRSMFLSVTVTCQNGGTCGYESVDCTIADFYKCRALLDGMVQIAKSIIQYVQEPRKNGANCIAVGDSYECTQLDGKARCAHELTTV